MKNLADLEKKINSELTTKINRTEIKHNQIYLETDKDDLIDVVLFLKTNNDTKFRQLIDITVVDYPEQTQRFKIIYLFLSHEFNHRMILSYSIKLSINHTKSGENDLCALCHHSIDIGRLRTPAQAIRRGSNSDESNNPC